MSFELAALLAAIALGFVHLSAAALSFKAQVGQHYSVGARDEELRPYGIAGRFERAYSNFRETFPWFAAAVLIVHATGTAGGWSMAGCGLYLAGRIVYLPLYALGVPWLRSFAWSIATLGVLLVAIQSLV